jgi:hypothetical protein
MPELEAGSQLVELSRRRRRKKKEKTGKENTRVDPNRVLHFHSQTGAAQLTLTLYTRPNCWLAG